LNAHSDFRQESKGFYQKNLKMKKKLFVFLLLSFCWDVYGQKSKNDSIAKADSIEASLVNQYIENLNKGIKYRREKKYKEALNEFYLSVAINSSYPEVYYHIGDVFFEMENYIKSIENLSKAIELGRRDFDVYFLRGMVKFYLGDYRGSNEDYLTAYKVSNKTDIKDFTSLFFNMGVCKSELRDYKGAIEDYTKALAFDERNLQALTNRGYYRIKVGDVSGGCSDLRKSGEMGESKAYIFIKEYCN
jgi:tetratricopeptide (TPR) repeat protein